MQQMKKADCQHCNNKNALMYVVDMHKHENGEILSDSYFYDMDVVLFCPSCNNYSLIRAYWDNTYEKNIDVDEYDIYNGDMVEETYLYPVVSKLTSKNKKYFPREVINNFDKAIELKSVDEASCLIKLRITLEMICNDQEAKGKTLYEKILYLSENGILPKTLNAASTLTKDLGNIGAHESSVEINLTELISVIELVEYIIQYIYVLPNEIEELENKFNLHKNNKEHISS